MLLRVSAVLVTYKYILIKGPSYLYWFMKLIQWRYTYSKAAAVTVVVVAAAATMVVIMMIIIIKA